MEPSLLTVVGFAALILPFVAALLCLAFDRNRMGAVMLWVLTAAAGGACVLGLWAGGQAGLVAAIGVVALLAYGFGSTFGKRKEHVQNRRRGGAFVVALWLWFCGSFALGYRAGGPLGLLTLTLPALAVFWGGMAAVAPFLLPVSERGQATQAFRSLVTFSLGNNFPYYVVEGDGTPERVPGNPYGQCLAGPGLVLADPAHGAVIWQGIKPRGVAGPGLTFTGRFDTVYEAVDLRTQLPSLEVEGLTKDGIGVKTEVLIACRLGTAGQEVALGSSFPLDEELTGTAVWQQPVEDGSKRTWHQAVRIAATRVLRQVIGERTCDQLCQLSDFDHDPRGTICSTLVSGLRNGLERSGIEVLDGWITNLRPVDPDVIEERIEAWRAQWQRKIMAKMGEARANALTKIESAYARAQAGLISSIQKVVEDNAGIRPEVLTKMAALRFIEALEDMVSEAQETGQVPADASDTLGYLHRTLTGEGKP